LVLCAGVFGFQHFTNAAVEPRPNAEVPPPSDSAPVPVVAPRPEREQVRSVPTASAAAQTRAPEKRPTRLGRPKPPTKIEPEVDEVRAVRIVIDGPQSATVRIDGQLRPWYERQELSVGPHTFEFIPPNTECCEHPPPRTVQVASGEGVQVVKGHIPFKPAILTLEAPPGARASCGVAGQLLAGESRRIALDEASLSLRCHVIPPPESAASPKEIDVALSPGRTFSIAWP